MFGSKQQKTVIAKGLKIVGSVTAEGLVEVNGQIDGELHCTSLVIARGAQVKGTVAAERVVVDGKVEGPIQGGEVILKSQAHVVGEFTTNLLPSRAVPTSMAVRCKFEKMARHLKDLKGNQRGKLQRSKKASLPGSSRPSLWKPISSTHLQWDGAGKNECRGVAK